MCTQVAAFAQATARITLEMFAGEKAKILSKALALIAELKFKSTVYNASVGDKTNGTTMPLRILVDSINKPIASASQQWQAMNATWVKAATSLTWWK